MQFGHKTIKVGSDFSGVGAFDYAVKRVAEAKGLEIDTIYACDLDKHARESYKANHGQPKYYPSDVYEREIPKESLDIYMTSPPCQAFSIAGSRKGKDDKRGILFFNSHEFIKKNKPRYFIFENVRGLLSDDNGKTFSEWVNMLGGKSVNGLPILFPYEDSVPYHIYHQVLNTKKHGIPQNRERVFIIGIRDDQDNFFRFPKEEPLTKRLKDVLEEEVDDKFNLSQESIDKLILYEKRNIEKGNGFRAKFHDPLKDVMSTLKVGGGGADDLIKVVSANEKGYTEAQPGDSVNFCNLNSTTNRGRVGKEGVCNALDTSCTQGVIVYDKNFWVADYRNDEGLRIREDNVSPCLATRKHSSTDLSSMPPIIHNIPEMVTVRKYEVDIEGLQKCLKEHKNNSIQAISELLNIKKTTVEHWFRTDKCFSIPDADIWHDLKKTLNIQTDEFDESIMEFEQKEGVFEKSNRVYDAEGIAPTMTSTNADERIKDGYNIRRLTPRECFRLQDFPDSFKFVVSDTQLYKQAGNSITVRVLEKILMNLKL